MEQPDPQSHDPVAAAPGSRALPWLAGAALVAVGLALVLLAENTAAPVVRGVVAPDFALPAISDGRPVALSALRGRVVLVNFWATWCKPCEDEMPAMERLYRRLGGAEFELIAISVDAERGEVERFRERLSLSFPILHDPGQDVAGRYQTLGFPESVLIDPSGRVVERYVGPRDWDHPAFAARIRRLMEGGAGESDSL